MFLCTCFFIFAAYIVNVTRILLKSGDETTVLILLCSTESVRQDEHSLCKNSSLFVEYLLR